MFWRSEKCVLRWQLHVQISCSNGSRSPCSCEACPHCCYHGEKEVSWMLSMAAWILLMVCNKNMMCFFSFQPALHLWNGVPDSLTTWNGLKPPSRNGCLFTVCMLEADVDSERGASGTLCKHGMEYCSTPSRWKHVYIRHRFRPRALTGLGCYRPFLVVHFKNFAASLVISKFHLYPVPPRFHVWMWSNVPIMALLMESYLDMGGGLRGGTGRIPQKCG